uniref:Uncharacterized protein n=1 Tax=Rhizophora mucronata TaxID=61149 RepID=A0A2P2QF29_RHIMU
MAYLHNKILSPSDLIVMFQNFMVTVYCRDKSDWRHDIPRHQHPKMCFALAQKQLMA